MADCQFLLLPKGLHWRKIMQETKIQLLPFEIELISDAGFILTKNAILKKINSFLFTIEATQKEIIQKSVHEIPEMIFKTSPKISKGENYKGLPWLVLDHPRYFEKNNVFAIRTMFWWGNFFSITLHLSGKLKDQMQGKILNNISLLSQDSYFLCINENEWEHHFESDNYIKISDLSSEEFESIMINKPFLKIAIRFPVDDFTNLEENLCSNYKLLISLFH